MTYTVKKLSELSKVTVRTLHFYEEIDLLKPAYYGSNGYRYYEEKELLQLQQILFFKKLGFSLKQIKKILGKSDFDQLTALYSHRRVLSQEQKKIKQLIETIDKTIKHMKGKKKMKEREFFNGFCIVTKAKSSDTYFAAENLVLKSVTNYEQSHSETMNKKANELYDKITDCLESGLEATSEEMQLLVKKHYTLVKKYHSTTKEAYKALAQLYIEHPEFRKQLDPIHPQLAEFLARAMDTFADTLD